jgi:glycosyltransferase involved in cell wall biosynthesis
LAVLAAEIMANRELGAGKERPPVAGSLDELLNRDGETFVRCAYATLLGREADSKGLRYFLGQLLLGSSREAIAAELSASREGRQFGARLPGLDGLVRRHHLLKTPIVGPFLRLLGVKRESRRAFPFLPLATITGEGAARIASSAAELLSLHDEAFVQSAYATLLGHDPDPDDLRGYLTRVRDGDSRHAILAEIRLSPEGQKRKNTLLGLNRVIRPYRWRRLPLLGPILRWVRANPERMDVPRKLASIETKLHLLSRLAPPAGVAERQDKPRPDSVPLRNSPPADAGSVARATSEDVSAKHGPEAVIWSSPLTWRIKEVCRETKQRTPIALEMERALAELGHDVRSAALNGAVDITALFASPPLPANASDRSTLLVGHDWEEGGYPAEWADQFNAGLGGVASASTHAMKVLIDHGVDVPLAAVGMGVDHWERISAALDYRAPGKTFRFLHFSSCTPDKAADLLLESFARVFDSDDDVSLIVKSSDEPPHELFALRERLLKANPRLPDIILIEDKMTDARLKALYGQCNVFVAPSRAEGFGLPIAQALLCGLPAVATAWGGHLDYCDETNSWLVDYRFQSAKTANDLIVSVWAEPLAHSLDESLWTAYRASPAERFAKSWSGRKRLLERGTWKDAALRLAALAQRAKAEVAVEPKKSRIGWITTWNVKCGIATHSAHLLASIPTDEFIVFAARQEPRIKSDEPNCLRSWNPGKDVNGLDEIAHKLLARSVDALVIQFNYGFFNHFELNEFIESVVAKGIVVVIDLHSTIDPHGERQNFRLTDFLSALRKCHRILAHGLEDMNRLKALGLVDNVMLFPHGVVKKGQDPTVPAKHYATPLVSSFGFCLPNKGLLELVHAVYLLKREGRSVRLRMLNAEHPTPESVAEVQRIKETIQRLDLQDSVEMHSEFLEEDVCLTLLGEADLVVNPYQLTGESASGSVRYGLAARRPVAVTPLPIFNDLGDAVFRMPGTTPREIAEGITSALRNIEEETETAKRVRFAARRWLDAHDYSLQAIRLMRMARALARREVLIGIANGEGS